MGNDARGEEMTERKLGIRIYFDHNEDPLDFGIDKKERVDIRDNLFYNRDVVFGNFHIPYGKIRYVHFYEVSECKPRSRKDLPPRG